MREVSRRVLVGAFSAIVVVSSISAQMQFEWNTGFPAGGLQGAATKSVMHDFGSGSGPVPVVAVADQLMRFDGHGWVPLGPKLGSGSVYDLASFNSQLVVSAPTAASLSLPAVFRWNGSQFAPLGVYPVGATGSALTVFDFGSGPRLCTFGTAGLQAWNGATWTAIPGSTITGFQASAMIGYDDGTGPALYAAATAATGSLRKWNGTAWQTIATTTGSITTLEVFDAGSGAKLYAGGGFTQIAGLPIAALARWDGGTSWSQLGVGLPPLAGATVQVNDLMAVPGSSPLLYVAGKFALATGLAISPFATWDGTSWSPVATSFTVSPAPMGYSLLSSGPTNARTIFVTGSFGAIGGVVAKNIAVRTPGSTTWAAYPADRGVGPGSVIDDGIRSMTTFDAGQGAGPELVVAGNFSRIGGTTASNIARWDGSRWHPLGVGTDGTIEAVTTWNDPAGTALFAKGTFQSAGGTHCNGIAKWNGTSWSALGSGLGTATYGASALLSLQPPFVPTPSLLVGGAFTTAGGAPVQQIAAWDGSSWSSVNNWSTGAINAFALYDDGSGLKLYAGGAAGGTIGGVATYGLKRFDGVSWSTVPGWTGTFSTVVRALTVFDDGQGPALYFGTSESYQPARFGKISPSGITSSVVTAVPGANPMVNALTVFNDGDGPGLLIGGRFNSIGGVTFAGIARLRNGAISPLGWGLFTFAQLAGTGYDANVKAIAIHDDGSGPAAFFGGDFDFAGSVASQRVAKYCAAPPMLTIAQPGPGAPSTIHCANLQSGREYLNVFSLEVSGGFPGSGPWLGLYASDPTMLMAQAAMPLGTWPFHFLAPDTTMSFGPYPVPSGLAVEAITIDMTGYKLQQVSPVASIVFQ